MRLLQAVTLVIGLMASSMAVHGAAQRSEIVFSNGAVVLAGTIVAPEEGGPFPGLVMVHGSGPGERWELYEVAERLASAGMAVLIYDKRGSGQSGGNWVASSLNDLADDAAAALRFLRDQPNVDAERSGLWGISQGGWVVPLAAEKGSAAFAIVVTGGGSAPRDVETHRYLSIVRRIDDSDTATGEVGDLLDAYFGYLAGEISYEVLVEVTTSLEDREWYDALGLERVIPGTDNRPNWAWVATFEPRDSIEKMDIPVLVLLGGKDPLTPTRDSALEWRESLASGAACSLVRVFPNAGHGIRTGGHGGDFAAGYFETQLDWLREIVVL